MHIIHHSLPYSRPFLSLMSLTQTKKERLCLFGVSLLPILKLDNKNAHAENVLNEAQQVLFYYSILFVALFTWSFYYKSELIQKKKSTLKKKARRREEASQAYVWRIFIWQLQLFSKFSNYVMKFHVLSIFNGHLKFKFGFWQLFRGFFDRGGHSPMKSNEK